MDSKFNWKPTWKAFGVNVGPKIPKNLKLKRSGILWDLPFFPLRKLERGITWNYIPCQNKHGKELPQRSDLNETSSETFTTSPPGRHSTGFLLFEVLQRSRVGERLTFVFGQLHLVRSKGPATVRITVHLHDGTLQAEVVAHLEGQGFLRNWDTKRNYNWSYILAIRFHLPNDLSKFLGNPRASLYTK